MPPGRDPGGIAIAVIGAGVDYLRPDIAGRLARDGEGEMIGWDIIDDDPFPLEAPPTKGRRIPDHAGTAMAAALLQAAPQARLIPVRLPDANVLALGGAMAFTRATPARIAVVLVGDGGKDQAKVLTEIIRQSPALLVIVHPAIAEAMAATAPTRQGPETVVSVVTLSPEGKAIGSGQPQAGPADLALADGAATGAVTTASASSTGDIAAAANRSLIEVAALAARILATSAALDGKALKRHILSLATAVPPDAALPAMHRLGDRDPLVRTR